MGFMTPDKFIAKWRDSTLKERSAAQSHFNDLCDMLGVEKPTDVDTTGDWYCFERGALKTAGGEGWADVWKRSHFGWEYKGKRKDLKAAYAQLQQYAVALENPPLLVVSDMDRFIVHTNWTNTVSEVHTIQLEDLKDAGKRDLLRWVFTDPDRLKPSKTIDALTREAADKFAGLAIRLHERGHEPHQVAHFVNRLVFCMFAEDINLLPRQLFSQLLDKAFYRPDIAQGLLEQLFGAMRSGGLFGIDEIEWFNGGLFDDASALPLIREDLKTIGEAAALDWSDIDPSIFGTLFERGLDPAKRSQLGAHYTDPEKIMMIVRPVILEPLWREWEAVKATISKARTSEKRKRELLGAFLERLRQYRVLDPACGSGNFLYLALLGLKDLEHRVNLDAEAMGLGRQFPSVGPQAVKGIEINPYAAELARVTVWIGEIQWMRKNGFDVDKKPILKALNHIECRDALLNEDGGEAAWPKADVLIGNPPFLGAKWMLDTLGDQYTGLLRSAYGERIPNTCDLVTYWFDKARLLIQEKQLSAVGLVATNMIRGLGNRPVMQKVAEIGIFEAWSDEPWIISGADVRVSIICLGQHKDRPKLLDGAPVSSIFPDLAAGAVDITTARPIQSNRGLAMRGIERGGPFDVPGDIARGWLLAPLNPNGRPNSDVLRPMISGAGIVRRPTDTWLIDFSGLTEAEAALYQDVFKYAEENIKSARTKNREQRTSKNWWLFRRSGEQVRQAISSNSRFIATPLVAKHRIFVWLSRGVIPDTRLVIIARSDDITFGILSSRIHEIWTLRSCQYHGVGNDPIYTHGTTFEMFPFPEGFSTTIAERIAQAAKSLNDLRENWLNPADLVRREQEIIPGYPERLVAIDDTAAAKLKKRTLTGLYNAAPSWLVNAHRVLDEAVAEAYGWPKTLSDEDILSRLLALNLQRSAEKAAKPKVRSKAAAE
jgi:type II restriction/modification system DNA methylase subunit YeeA